MEYINKALEGYEHKTDASLLDAMKARGTANGLTARLEAARERRAKAQETLEEAQDANRVRGLIIKEQIKNSKDRQDLTDRLSTIETLKDAKVLAQDAGIYASVDPLQTEKWMNRYEENLKVYVETGSERALLRAATAHGALEAIMDSYTAKMEPFYQDMENVALEAEAVVENGLAEVEERNLVNRTPYEVLEEFAPVDAFGKKRDAIQKQMKAVEAKYNF